MFLSNSPINTKIKCKDGYILEDGKIELLLKCISGNWEIQSNSTIYYPESCNAVCKPECVNGGRCIKPGVCRCNNDFIGKLCEVFKKDLICDRMPLPTKNSIITVK